jgi:hypothetical protein
MIRRTYERGEAASSSLVCSGATFVTPEAISAQYHTSGDVRSGGMLGPPAELRGAGGEEGERRRHTLSLT